MNSDDKESLRRMRDTLFDLAPKLTVYLGAMEAATSSSATQVAVQKTVRKVMSVWLAGDMEYSGVNYYANPLAENFTGSTITLDSELPAASTKLQVAYYADCPDCEWDNSARASRDSNCATCSGKGMVLDLGSALQRPAAIVPRGKYIEQMTQAGQEAAGRLVFRSKAEHLAIIKAAVQLEYAGYGLKTVHEAGVNFALLPNAAGEIAVVEWITEYKTLQ